MQKKTKIIAGIVGIMVFIGGGIATAHYKPFAKTTVVTVTPIVAPTVDKTTIASTTAAQEAAVADNVAHTVAEPNDGLYHVKTDRPAGIIIYSITFHQGFRAAGLQAVDVHIIARSKAKENELIQNRDEIISITGSTGEVYDMTETKRTGVNTNADYDNFQEQEITQYKDVSINEKSITSIVLRRDGKNITVKPDADTKYDTTYPPKAEASTTTTSTEATVTPKATTASTATPAKTVTDATPKATTATTTTPKVTTPATPAKTVGKLTIYKWSLPERPGDYYGDIVNGEADGNGEVHWHNVGKDTSNESFKGKFMNNAPYGKGILTYTDEKGVIHTQETTEIYGIEG